MDLNEFRKRGPEMVDYIVDYLESLSQRRVTPNVIRGSIKSSLPSTAPMTGESYEDIMKDIEKYIMPGLTHWQHPGFHAYFPSNSSFPATLGSMLADMLGCVDFNWNTSPSGSELEIILLNWYGKLIGLPEYFLRSGGQSKGAGILERSSSECIFISMVTARCSALGKLTNMNPSMSRAVLLSSLVAYCSKEAYFRIEKIALVALVNIRILDTDGDYRLRGETLNKAIEEDKKIGLIPFYVNITLGTISCGSCDPLNELGPICEKHGVWLHVDAGYAGTAMVCPEYKHILKGIEYASSFNSNPDAWMLVHLDCSVLYVKDRFKLKNAVFVDRTNFGYTFVEKDWGFPSKTEFLAMKLFFVMRNYGIEGLQKHIRNHVRLAKIFEDYVRRDDRFEFITCHFGVVCFRLKGSDIINTIFKERINSLGTLYMTPCRLGQKYVIRFAVCTERANEEDIKYAWDVICEQAVNILHEDPKEYKQSSSEVFEEFCKYNLL